MDTASRLRFLVPVVTSVLTVLTRLHVSAENSAQNRGGGGGGGQKAARPSSSAHSAFQPQRSNRVQVQTSLATEQHLQCFHLQCSSQKCLLSPLKLSL